MEITYLLDDLRRRSKPRPIRPAPIILRVPASGTWPMTSPLARSPCTVVSPTLAPELGATILVGVVISKSVKLKLPVNAPVLPGPSTTGDQAMVTVLELNATLPPAEVPTNSPVAPSDWPVMIRSKVKAAKCAEFVSFVKHASHTSEKIPKLMLDGTPVAMFASG